MWIVKVQRWVDDDPDPQYADGYWSTEDFTICYWKPLAVTTARDWRHQYRSADGYRVIVRPPPRRLT